MFCSKCGIKLTEGSVFCSGCGVQINSTEQPQHTTNSNNSNPIPEDIRCPKCESQNLQVTLETTTTSSGGGYSGAKGCLGFLLLGPLGLLCGSGGKKVSSSTEHKNFWICMKCGHKFRKAEEVLEETLFNFLSSIGLFIASAVGLFILSSLRLPSFINNPLSIGLAVLLILSIILAAISGFEYNRLTEEQKAAEEKSEKDETK